MKLIRRCVLVFVAAVGVSGWSLCAQAQDELTKEQKIDFLLHAKVTNSRDSTKGVTPTKRLTLSDGKISHDASFQSIDEHKMSAEMSSGRTEMNFVDSYKYNIAAYDLAELLGLEDLMPVTVERKWNGETGSLSWWLPAVMDDQDRAKKKIMPPDLNAWNKQMLKIRVLNQLIYDADPNQTNVLIGKDWQLWRIDYSRGFRTYKQLQDPSQLTRCDRQLFEKLKKLDANELRQKTQHYLTRSELGGIMARRDLLVAHFQKLIAEKGENEVLY